MVRSHGENLWVGLTDRGTEDVWRFVTDKTFYKQEEANPLFPRATGEPQNKLGGEHCACVGFAVKHLDVNKRSENFHRLNLKVL